MPPLYLLSATRQLLIYYPKDVLTGTLKRILPFVPPFPFQTSSSLTSVYRLPPELLLTIFHYLFELYLHLRHFKPALRLLELSVPLARLVYSSYISETLPDDRTTLYTRLARTFLLLHVFHTEYFPERTSLDICPCICFYPTILTTDLVQPYQLIHSRRRLFSLTRLPLAVTPLYSMYLPAHTSPGKAPYLQSDIALIRCERVQTFYESTHILHPIIWFTIDYDIPDVLISDEDFFNMETWNRFHCLLITVFGPRATLIFDCHTGDVHHFYLKYGDIVGSADE